MNNRFFDKPAATEKNNALIKQLHPAILPDTKDRKSMLNTGIFFYYCSYIFTLLNIENYI